METTKIRVCEKCGTVHDLQIHVIDHKMDKPVITENDVEILCGRCHEATHIFDRVCQRGQ